MAEGACPPLFIIIYNMHIQLYQNEKAFTWDNTHHTIFFFLLFIPPQ